MHRAVEDARELLLDEIDSVVRGLMESYDWYNVHEDIDYNGGWHSAIIDRAYRPIEAVDILETYDQYEETDSGLWDGVGDWRKILSIIAAFTYSNACFAEAQDFWDTLQNDFGHLRDHGLDWDEEPIPADNNDDPIDPWYENEKSIEDWAAGQLKSM